MLVLFTFCRTKSQIAMNLIQYIIRTKSSRYILSILSVLFVFGSCSDDISKSKKIDQNAVIYPDYSGITIPCNIASLNFVVKEPADKYVAVYSLSGKEQFRLSSGDGIITVPSGKWEKLLKEAKGQEFTIDIYIKKGSSWLKYNTITNKISPDSIDSCFSVVIADDKNYGKEANFPTYFFRLLCGDYNRLHCRNHVCRPECQSSKRTAGIACLGPFSTHPGVCESKVYAVYKNDRW